MTTKRFVFSYDDEYDADISAMLESTPKRRQSERVRQLLRAGMEAEQKNSSLSHPVSSSSSNTQRPEKKRPSIPPIQPL